MLPPQRAKLEVARTDVRRLGEEEDHDNVSSRRGKLHATEFPVGEAIVERHGPRRRTFSGVQIHNLQEAMLSLPLVEAQAGKPGSICRYCELFDLLLPKLCHIVEGAVIVHPS